MSDILFKTNEDITYDWVQYIENESRALAQREEFAIQNYVDREILNPAVKNYLETIDDDDNDIDEKIDVKNVSNLVMLTTELTALELNYTQEAQVLVLPEWLRFRFRKIKKKVLKVFCSVVGELINGGELDVKSIIKTVLIALIPAFASGFPAVVLPIIIGLVAYLLKYGYIRVCPA